MFSPNKSHWVTNDSRGAKGIRENPPIVACLSKWWLAYVDKSGFTEATKPYNNT